MLLSLVGQPGCRCSRNEPTNEASHQAREAACRAACAAYFTAGCGPADAPPLERSDCQAACVAKSAVSERAGCRREREAFLSCLARDTLDCSAVASAPAAALERAEGAAACSAELATFSRCFAPCAEPGTVHLGDTRDQGRLASAELTRHGCEQCPDKLGPGAPEGSPCTVARVCAQQCCGCDAGPGHYLARACVDGTCAGRALACDVAPRATGHEVCP